MVAVHDHVLIRAGPPDEDHGPGLLPLLGRAAHLPANPGYLTRVLRPAGIPFALVGHVDLGQRHHLRAVPWGALHPGDGSRREILLQLGVATAGGVLVQRPPGRAVGAQRLADRRPLPRHLGGGRLTGHRRSGGRPADVRGGRGGTLRCNRGLRHRLDVLPQDQVLPVHQDRLVPALNRRLVDLRAEPVQRPRAVPQPGVPDLLHDRGIPVVDLAELGLPALHAEALHRDVEVELLQQDRGDGITGVDDKAPVLRVAGSAAQVPGLDHAALGRGDTAAGEDRVTGRGLRRQHVSQLPGLEFLDRPAALGRQRRPDVLGAEVPRPVPVVPAGHLIIGHPRGKVDVDVRREPLAEHLLLGGRRVQPRRHLIEHRLDRPDTVHSRPGAVE